MKASAPRLEIIKTPEEFDALHDQWNALWTLADGRHHESFSACRLSWEHVAKPLGRTLRIIAVRDEARLIAVWPLVRSRNRLWNVLRPLSPESADYTTVLCDPDHASPALMDSIWQAARVQCAADIILLPYLDCKSELYRLVSEQARVMVAKEHPYAVARLSLEKDWNSFIAGLGKLANKKPGALYQRLEREGKVELRTLGPEDREENARMVEWMLARKRDWAERVDKKGDWLYAQSYGEYLVALLNHRDEDACARLNVLTLNGEILAVNMIGLGKRSIMGMMGGFDRRFSKFAPGAVTTEAWAHWALERGFDFDLGIGAETFKAYWSKNNIEHVSSVQIAQTNWGRVAFAMASGQSALAAWRGRRNHADADPAKKLVKEPVDGSR